MCLIIGFLIIIYISYRVYQHFFPTPNINPNDKYVLISGCDTGFGNALSKELDKQGFNVLAGIYDLKNKDSLASVLSSRATVFKLDVTRQEDIDDAYEMISKKTPVLHALVNNAGIGAGGLIDWISLDFIRHMMDVNFLGHVAMTKKFLPLLIAKRGSRVVNICSAAGFFAKPGMSAYAASKYALEAFSDCLRREMAVWGLHVSIIEPGFMRTAIVQGHEQSLQDLWNKLSDDVKDRWGKQYLHKQIQAISNDIFMKNAEDPMKVVQVLQHAVMNTAPRIRYRPGWQSSCLVFPLSQGPAWLADLLYIKLSSRGALPAGIRTQLPE